MKYIITDKNEVRTGGMYHKEMGDECEGKVIRAGHYTKNKDGTYKVFGESIGYSIEAKEEDAQILLDVIK